MFLTDKCPKSCFDVLHEAEKLLTEVAYLLPNTGWYLQDVFLVSGIHSITKSLRGFVRNEKLTVERFFEISGWKKEWKRARRHDCFFGSWVVGFGRLTQQLSRSTGNTEQHAFRHNYCPVAADFQKSKNNTFFDYYFKISEVAVLRLEFSWNKPQ